MQDIFRTKTAEMADVVLPASASWAEAEGTVTSSERRVQRVRKALDPPGEARDDVEIVYELGSALGVDLGSPRPEDVWNELRTLSPDARRHVVRAARGARRHPVAVLGRRASTATSSCTAGCGTTSSSCRRRSHRSSTPAGRLLDDEFPVRLTTGRRLESFNTGVQTGGFSSPLHVGGEALRVSPEDGARYGLRDGGRARRPSRRGAVEAPVAFDENLRPGLAFMNLHFPDVVETNVLTIDATDPKSGTAEFKATAIRVEALAARPAAARARCRARPSARRSTQCSAHRDATRTAAPPTTTARSGTCSCPRCAPRSCGSAG